MMDAPEHSVLLTVTQPRFWQVARQAAAAGSLSVTSPSSLLMLKDAGPAAVVFMVLTTVVGALEGKAPRLNAALRCSSQTAA